MKVPRFSVTCNHVNSPYDRGLLKNAYQTGQTFLYGKKFGECQNGIAVFFAMRRTNPVEHRRIAGKFPLPLQLERRKPSRRIEPVNQGYYRCQPQHQRIETLDMDQFMQ